MFDNVYFYVKTPLILVRDHDIIMIQIVSKNSGGLAVSVTKSMDTQQLDKEWIDLILAARNMGLSLEEVRAFLKESGETRSDQEASRR